MIVAFPELGSVGTIAVVRLNPTQGTSKRGVGGGGGYPGVVPN